MRLEVWLIGRLVHGHISADLAGLNHPARADNLAYLHNANRIANPYEERCDLKNELEKRVCRGTRHQPEPKPRKHHRRTLQTP